jgi:hypothetical protein
MMTMALNSPYKVRYAPSIYPPIVLSCSHGAILISGIYDLTSLGFLANQLYVKAAFGSNRTFWKESSPEHALRSHRGTLSKFLIINPRRDFHPLQQQADTFTTLLRIQGARSRQLVWDDTNHSTILRAFRPKAAERNLTELVVDFVLNGC